MKSTFVKVTALATLLLTISCGGKDSKKKEETKATPEVSASLEIEKPQLTFGFIKLTDMAPLAIAKKKDFLKKRAFRLSRSTIQLEKHFRSVLLTVNWTVLTC